MRAAETLDSMEARAPWYGPGTKRGGLRRVAPVGDIPGGSGALDDQVRIIADLLPGSENGPQVPDNLAHWGLRPGRAHRALLNWAHWRPDPGVRARPLGQRAHGLDIIDGKPVPVLKPAQPTSDWARRVSIDGTLSPLFSYETDPAYPIRGREGRMRARPWGRPAPC